MTLRKRIREKVINDIEQERGCVVIAIIACVIVSVLYHFVDGTRCDFALLMLRTECVAVFPDGMCTYAHATRMSVEVDDECHEHIQLCKEMFNLKLCSDNHPLYNLFIIIFSHVFIGIAVSITYLNKILPWYYRDRIDEETNRLLEAQINPPPVQYKRCSTAEQ